MLAGAVFLCLFRAGAQDYVPPAAQSGVFDITAYGAIPNDGLPDDAAWDAAQLALWQTLSREGVLYVPGGTVAQPNVYDFVRQRRGSNAFGVWHANTNIQCGGRETTILRLADNTPAFDDPREERAFLHQGSEADTPFPHATYAYQGGGGSGFKNRIQDCTIDLGTGNAGAVGTYTNWSNDAGIRNVRIVGTGCRAGIAMFRGSDGPWIAKNVEIFGCAYAFRRPRNAYGSVTIDGLTIAGQTVVGVETSGNSMQIRNLVSNQTVPGVRAVVQTPNESTSLLVIDGADLVGADPNLPAIASDPNTPLYVRNATSSGYSQAVQGVAGATVAEHFSHPFTGPQYGTLGMLGLPVQEAPDAPFTDPNDFVSVRAFGAHTIQECPNCDNTGAFQAAIDSGKKVVYCPKGDWPIGGNITLRANVAKLRGYGCLIRTLSGVQTHSGQLLTVDDGTAPVVTIEGIDVASNFTVGNSSPALLHRKRTLVLRFLEGPSYENEVGSGDLFIESFNMGGFARAHGINVWARQLNIEYTGEHFLNDGGRAWIFGFKTERQGELIRTTNGGRTELLGGYHLPTGWQANPITASSMFTSIDSHHSLIIATSPDGPKYANPVHEEHGGVGTDIPSAQFAGRGNGQRIIYSRWDPEQSPPTCESVTPGVVGTPATASAVNAGSITVPVTVPAGVHRMLVLAISTEDSSPAAVATGVTWGAQALVQVGSGVEPAGINAAELWALPNATPGTGDVVATLSKPAANEVRAVAYALQGLEQVIPTLVATQSATAFPISTAITPTGSVLLVDAIGEALGGGTSLTTTESGQSKVAQQVSGGASVASSIRPAAAGPSAMGWTRTGGANRLAHVIGAFGVCP